jgi:uncharacterized C2H2 Zn-finger protein
MPWRCLLLGHRLRFVRVSPDGYRIWRCTRCGKVKRGAMVPL